jgi:small membrane protein
MAIRVVIIASLALLLFLFLRNRSTTRFQAGKKIIFLLFVGAAIAAVVSPDLVTAVAEALGVGRGADLLLYAFIVAFLFVTVNVYVRFKDVDARYTELARRVAIDEAVAVEPGSHPS